MLNKIMSGKKKITASIIIPIAAIILNYLGVDQEETVTITGLIGQYFPAMLATAAGLFYTNKEAGLDKEKEKTKQAEAAKVTAEGVIKEAEILAPLAEEAYFEPFDQEAFSKKLEARAAKTYLEITPITVFFATQDKGKITRCTHIDQALAYWDFLRSQVREAFKHMFGFPFEEAENHLDDNKTCPYYSVDNMARQMGIHTWNMLRNVRWVTRKQQDLEGLADTDIDWQAKIASRDQTFFSLGALAGELLKHNPQTLKVERFRLT